MQNDEMPERIWLIPNAGNDGETVWCDDPAPGADMDPDDAAEYLRRDLCASGQVRALMDASEYLAREYEKGGFPSYANLARHRSGSFTLCTIRAIEKAQHDALTSAPHPAPVTAQEAVPVAWRYRYVDPVSGKPIWRYSNNLWNGQRPSESQPLFAHPPQPSETVAEAATHALDACRIIDAAVLEGHDNVSDLICHLLEAVEPARAALRALKEAERNALAAPCR
ncbi:hypothetical protein ACNKFW_15375 (plasmid) [Paracoccus sp. TD-10]|uniref:hypothetical protein n=1 Tax=Paracoccus sp. TD-10 TaxID=3395918 RepID=UPI003AAFFF7A